METLPVYLQMSKKGKSWDYRPGASSSFLCVGVDGVGLSLAPLV